MSAATPTERLTLMRLAAGSALNAAMAQGLRVPLLNTGLMRPLVDELLFVPPDLRPTDPSLADELASGQMGLAGTTVDFGRGSPFAVGGAPVEWLRELHGFGWLGGLRAAGGDTATELARGLVADWCRRNRRRPGGTGVAAEPAVIGRRVMAWLAGAGLLLEGADDAFYRIVTQALGQELRALDIASRTATPGYPRLVPPLALLMAALAIQGQGGEIRRRERRLLDELGRQLLADGGHVTRNPDVALDIALDLLPLRECYVARGLTVPSDLAQAIERVHGHLARLSPGDGSLARFHGTGPARVEALSVVMALAGGQTAQASAPGASGYARLSRGATVVLVDCGRPPPLVLAQQAHAGALSLELAHAGEAILVNRGAPRASLVGPAADARATVSHSTLVLDDTSSARLVRGRSLERLGGAPAIAGPDAVTAFVEETADGVTLKAAHDGYLRRLGLMHERFLTLSADGRRLEGTDRLGLPGRTVRLARDLPFAIHFHVPTEASVARSGPQEALIATRSGQRWRLGVEGAQLGIESAVSYSGPQGPAGALQVVLRGATPGESEVRWVLARV